MGYLEVLQFILNHVWMCIKSTSTSINTTCIKSTLYLNDGTPV